MELLSNREMAIRLSSWDMFGGCTIAESNAAYNAAMEMGKLKDEQLIEQLAAFAVHLNKRGAFCEDLCMDFEHEAQSFIEFREYQNNKEL